MRDCTKFYIDGQWVDPVSEDTRPVENPATEETIGHVSFGTKADVDKAVKAARRAFESFSQTSREERLTLLRAIQAEIENRKEELATAVSDEMGAPMSLANGPHVGLLAGHCATAIEILERFEFERQDGPTLHVWEPIGVVGMITPWNWPLNQIACKVFPALATGNTMILKPSEIAPFNAYIFAEIMDAAGIPAGVFNLVNGDGPGVGEAISGHPDIDMVSFTGSTRAGVLIAKNAADTVKRVHQELGGKSPNIVLPDADLAQVLPPTVQGVLVNTGQSCIAPTRILVHKDRKEEAVGVIKAMFDGTQVGDPAQEGGHIGPVVNKAQFEKIQGLIQSAIDEGATLETGGTGLPANVNRGYFIKPTVFSGVTPDMRIAKEEVFGPVATIMEYSSLDEAVDIANDTEYGLSAVVSGDPSKAAEVAPKLRAGMVAVNAWGPGPGAPFGGYKASGNGREGGLFGLKDFMEVKAISGIPA